MMMNKVLLVILLLYYGSVGTLNNSVKKHVLCPFVYILLLLLYIFILFWWVFTVHVHCSIL